MSERDARVRRRDLRRALGDTGLTVLQSHAKVIREDILPKVDEHEKAVTELRDADTQMAQRFSAFYGRSFVARWRWLMLGR